MFRKIFIAILWKLPPSQRDRLKGFKRFGLFKRKKTSKQLFIIFIDGSTFHGGLTDRFKGIISTFLYCLQQDIDFRIHYTSPFSLSDYLSPNSYDWQLAKEESISYNFFESKYMYLIGDPSANRLIKLHSKKQIHCFANRDIVPELNKINNTNHQWGELFKILFKPSSALQEQLRSRKQQIGGEYIAIVFRFQNLLGDFTEYNVQALLASEKQKLINKCKSALLQLQQSLSGERILVTSDSSFFLQGLLGLPNIFTFPTKVVHIDNTTAESQEVYMSSFVDLYSLSESKAIYSIGNSKMYKTEFPLYAAKINNIPFHRILIE